MFLVRTIETHAYDLKSAPNGSRLRALASSAPEGKGSGWESPRPKITSITFNPKT